MSTPLPADEREPDRWVRFGEFELRPLARQLLHRGRRVAIQPKPFDVLVYLIAHRDRVVTHAELRDAVWRGVHVDVTTVRSALYALRRALADGGDPQKVIRTMPGRGFRFVAPVDEATPDAATRRDGPGEANRVEWLDSLFLGRARFLAEAHTLLDDAAHGTSRVLLLCGEAGIGKSRALEQLAQLAEGQGFRVLAGRCVESEGAPAFWPWVQMLRAAVGSDPPESLLRSLGESAPEVAWMVPELRPFVRDVPQMASFDARAARFMLFDALSRFLAALAAEQPMLLCIDDLHRADTASLALLHHVADELARTQPCRLALAGSYRERELRAAPTLTDLMAAIGALPHVRTEALHGLEAADVGALVRSLCGSSASQRVVSELHHKTSGNPFFLHQILRVLEAEDRLGELASAQTLALELPRHVQDAICRQVQLLPESARALIEVASVMGREFGVTELEAALGLPREAVLERLAHAVEAGVVCELDRGLSRFRFVHALVGDAIYARLSLDLRGDLHGRIARALAARADDSASADSATLAHHYAHSSRRGDRERAIRAFAMAARWSGACGAFENAPEFLEQSLALLAESAPQARAERCRLLVELGAAWSNAGARARARETLLAAAEIAQQQGLPEELAAAALHFAPDFLAIETGVYDPELVQLLERAIAALGDSHDSLRAKLLARLAIALQWSAEDGRSRALCAEAGRIAAQGRDEQVGQYVEVARSLVHFSLVEPQRQLQRGATGRGASASLDLLERLLRITSWLLLGRIRETDAEIALFADLADRSRHPQARWYVDLMRSTRALMEGRFAEAEESRVRFLALGEKIGDRNAAQSHFAQSLMRAFDVGDVEIFESHVRGIVEAYPRMVAWSAAHALVLAELDRVEQARIELRRVFDAAPLESARPNEWYGTATALALAAGALGEGEIAAALYEALRPHAEQLIVFGYCSDCIGSTHRLLAALATGTENWQLAIYHFEAALSRNAEVGAFASNARVHFELARMLMRAGERADGMERARRAEAAASQFGMTRLVKLSRGLCQ